MSTLEERVAVLEVNTSNQQKTIDDHEDRLRDQEEVKAVVEGLVVTTKNLKDTSEVLVSTMNDMKVEKAKAEGIANMFKNIKLKDVAYMIAILISAISMLTGKKVDNATLNEFNKTVEKLEKLDGLELIKEGETNAESEPTDAHQ